jgi:hypothetical protein
MEIETVHRLLTDVGLSHPADGDSEELKALRNISLALLHMANAIQELQRQARDR